MKLIATLGTAVTLYGTEDDAEEAVQVEQEVDKEDEEQGENKMMLKKERMQDSKKSISDVEHACLLCATSARAACRFCNWLVSFHRWSANANSC